MKQVIIKNKELRKSAGYTDDEFNYLCTTLGVEREKASIYFTYYVFNVVDKKRFTLAVIKYGVDYEVVPELTVSTISVI